MSHNEKLLLAGSDAPERADKLKVAAWLHHVPMKAYFQSILEAQVKDLEKNGIPLVLPKGK